MKAIEKRIGASRGGRSRREKQKWNIFSDERERRKERERVTESSTSIQYLFYAYPW